MRVGKKRTIYFSNEVLLNNDILYTEDSSGELISLGTYRAFRRTYRLESASTGFLVQSRCFLSGRRMASTTELVTESVQDLSKKKPENPPTFLQRCSAFKSQVASVVTVEPLIGAYVMASTLCLPMILNLEFEKSCRVNLGLNDTVCEAILSGQPQNYQQANDDIQVLISDMHSWQQPVQSIMPLLLVLFLGSYSDRHKWRKPFLILPIFGEFFSVIGVVLCVVYMKSWPLEAQGVVQGIIPSFFGGQTMLVMAVFAYVADVSTLEMRTLRVGVIQVVLNAIVPITQLFSGDLFELAGYYVILAMAGALYLFAFLYGIFCIKEPREPVKTEGSVLRDIFNPNHALDTFKLIFQKKPGNNLLYIWLVLLTLFIYSAVVVGESSVFYFLVQSVYQWDVSVFSYYLSINTLVHLIGTILAVPLFTKILKLSDLSILLVTFLDKILCNLVFVWGGFVVSSAYLWAAAIVSIITGVTAVGIRSLATKIVSQDDLGKAQSVFGICEVIAPAIAIPVYNKLYKHTLTSFPSAFFVLGIILYVICCVVIGWMYIREKRKVVAQVKPTNGEANGSNKFDYQTTHL